MGYNLQPGTSQDDIDRYYGDDRCPDWQCQDPECGAFWAGDDIEYFPCDQEGCEVIGCDECRAKCFSCDKSICSAHRRKYDDGDGKLRYWCAECIAAYEAQDLAERKAS